MALALVLSLFAHDSPHACARPDGWCAGDHRTFSSVDCDGDGLGDLLCTDNSEIRTRVSGADCAQCRGPWGTCPCAAISPPPISPPAPPSAPSPPKLPPLPPPPLETCADPSRFACRTAADCTHSSCPGSWNGPCCDKNADCLCDDYCGPGCNDGNLPFGSSSAAPPPPPPPAGDAVGSAGGRTRPWKAVLASGVLAAVLHRCA